MLTYHWKFLAKNSNLLQNCSFHIGNEIFVLCPFHAPQKNVGPKIFVAKILCYMFHRQTFWKCDCECVQKTFWHLILKHYICNIYTHSLWVWCFHLHLQIVTNFIDLQFKYLSWIKIGTYLLKNVGNSFHFPPNVIIQTFKSMSDFF